MDGDRNGSCLNDRHRRTESGAEPTESLFVAIDPEPILDTRSGVGYRNAGTVKLPVSDDFAGAID
jgi:hypothetical protein